MTTITHSPHLIWVCPMALSSKLDAATWLDTTRELRQMGWHVTLVTSGSQDGIQMIRGVEIFCIAVPKIYFLRYILFHWRFLKHLRKWAPADIILLDSSSILWILPLRILRILRNRNTPLFVADIRTLHMSLISKQGWKGHLRYLYEKLTSALSIRWADGQTVITALMARSMRIPPEKVWGVWPSGVNAQHFEACFARRNWPINNEPVSLGYIGALEYERNLMGLAIAVERANAEGMSFQFTLVGDGAQRAELEKYAQDSSGHITVTPSIPYDEVPDFLSQVHVGVLPFPDEEKFQVCSPIKLFEYMAAGLSILATRIPCHTDVMKDGSYVFWAESADEDGLMGALRALWQERHTLKNLSEESVSAAQAWTWHEAAAKLKSALESGMLRYTDSTSSRINALHEKIHS